jgi:hypothetical protein
MIEIKFTRRRLSTFEKRQYAVMLKEILAYILKINQYVETIKIVFK